MNLRWGVKGRLAGERGQRFLPHGIAPGFALLESASDSRQQAVVKQIDSGMDRKAELGLFPPTSVIAGS